MKDYKKEKAERLLSYHERQRREHIKAEERLGKREDEFYKWIEETKFDEFGTYKDRYEDDLAEVATIALVKNRPVPRGGRKIKLNASER